MKYYCCPKCGFIQTENPWWINEAYTDAIADLDIGILERNIFFSNVITAILKICLDEKNNFLDYGGGYGIFVRIMRDKGFDFNWYDKYSSNLFAKYFDRTQDQYDAITALELFEHFNDPIDEINEMFKWGDNIIFSTELVPKNLPKIKD